MAEMTGRRGRVVRTDKQQEPHYEARESDNSSVEGLNVQEVSEERARGRVVFLYKIYVYDVEYTCMCTCMCMCMCTCISAC